MILVAPRTGCAYRRSNLSDCDRHAGLGQRPQARPAAGPDAAALDPYAATREQQDADHDEAISAGRA